MKITLTLHISRSKKPEPQPAQQPRQAEPEGNNFTQSEIAGESDRNHELNSHDRPSHYGRAISMKWHPNG